MGRNLCIDIGNSRIKMALFEEGKVQNFSVFNDHSDNDISKWISANNFEKAIYSSVIKSSPPWLNLLSANVELLQLNAAVKTPLKIHYKTPETLGSDRVAAMVGAMSFSENMPLFVVNAGTCITYDLVNQHAEFVGGNIAPGLDMRCKAMHTFTERLPEIKFHDPGSSFLGYDTISAMQNGALQGVVLEIEGYYNKLKKNYLELKCIITGGNAAFLVNHLKIGIFAEPYLVLKGLNTILNYQ
ncbi:MAG: type III pantothenate kinase [Saprospiraceae bacterium]|nr:type III pantothenate kinase [Saprospiraceae bacterium]MBK8450142.1 type III pantothenate kinase [Saprospiraceae bacterium]MBK8483761.1 type III pantothenate kinase [Saprospiraceae bacterium]MBK9721852.1 type III pantothenate kinase [Saprospiraceae bacterium]MBK9728913.1 type III pantothenate kinase [Saprospiraceae bacterium]